MGTNNKIFEMQTAAIRYELGDHHTYEFVEGIIPWAAAPEVKAFSATSPMYFCYFDPESAREFKKAVDDLDAYITAEGTFDAVMGFSQGALLASTLIARNEKQRLPQPFKCAVFFSGGVPADYDALSLGRLHGIDLTIEGEAISIPTTHVWGSKDQQWPGRAFELSKVCSPRVRTIYIHDGGHEAPGSKSKSAVTSVVHAIRRTIDQAIITQ
ncbi:hypothetical protein MMC17_007709 [Xylographa soralifera]|nr:hypothetical protein [Xylographa soralifera]